MPKLAINASTAAKWQLSDEPEAGRARLMLRDYAVGRVVFIAPSIWHYEVANIVNKAVGTQRLTEEEGDMAFQALQALDIEYVLFPTPAEAYKLARTYQRSVYDSLYLAVAQSHQIDLWTGDRRLYNAVSQSLPFVKWIGDYESLNHPCVALQCTSVEPLYTAIVHASPRKITPRPPIIPPARHPARYA